MRGDIESTTIATTPIRQPRKMKNARYPDIRGSNPRFWNHSETTEKITAANTDHKNGSYKTSGDSQPCEDAKTASGQEDNPDPSDEI